MAMLKSMKAQMPQAAAGLPQGKITSANVQAKMHLTPQQGVMMQRIVVAGMKVMFDAKTHSLMLDQLKGPGTISQKIGQGVAGLMAMLMQESKNSLPGNLLIPAGLVLSCKAAEFLRGSGQLVSDADLAEAMNVMTREILNATGTDPDKVAEMAQSGSMKKPGMKPGVAPVLKPTMRGVQP